MQTGGEEAGYSYISQFFFKLGHVNAMEHKNRGPTINSKLTKQKILEF